MTSTSRRREIPQPDADAVYAVIKRYKRDEPEVAEQLEQFFDLFRGMGVPMTFSPVSLAAMDESFPALMEQIDQEAENSEAEGEDLMIFIQLCGFWLGTLIIEELGGKWQHDPDEGSLVSGAKGAKGDIDPFDPFIRKAQNPAFSLLREFERLTGMSVAAVGEEEL